MTRASGSWRTRLIGAAVACGALAVAVAQPAALPWALVLLAGALGWAGWRWWYDNRGPGALVAALRGHWLGLHGAQPTARGVHVHDGVQPIDVRLSASSGRLEAVVLTRLEEDTLAFRMWPDSQAPPAFPEGTTRAMLSRAPGVEARFANLLRLEGNDLPRLGRRMTGETLAPALVVRKEAGAAFAGVTWDGQRLGVHWAGPVASDPERVMALSRPIWRAFADS